MQDYTIFSPKEPKRTFRRLIKSTNADHNFLSRDFTHAEVTHTNHTLKRLEETRQNAEVAGKRMEYGKVQEMYRRKKVKPDYFTKAKIERQIMDNGRSLSGIKRDYKNLHQVIYPNNNNGLNSYMEYYIRNKSNVTENNCNIKIKDKKKGNFGNDFLVQEVKNNKMIYQKGKISRNMRSKSFIFQ